MKILQFEDEISWKEARKTKITGTRLADIVVLRGTNEKKGYYELIAERLAKPRPENENKMERGHILESEAIELLEEKLGKTFNKELVIWTREENECIAISPDGFTEDLKEAVEVKCLGQATQIESAIKNTYPDEYRFQIYQYFIVNDLLETLYFIMYDPSLIVKQLLIFPIKRDEIQIEISKYLEYERCKLEQINNLVNQLSF